MYGFLVIESKVAFLDAATLCGKWQRLSRVLPSPSGYIYHSSMMISHAMTSEGSKVMHIQQCFLALLYVACDFSGFLETFHDIV